MVTKQIISPNKESLNEAIKIFPILPVGFNIHLIASPKYVSLTSISEYSEYLSECESQKIIPFSRICFKYNKLLNVFTPVAPEIDPRNILILKTPDNIRRWVIDLILSGGKIDKIKSITHL